MKKPFLAFFPLFVLLFLILLFPTPAKAADLCVEPGNSIVPCGRTCVNPVTGADMPCGSCVANINSPLSNVTAGQIVPCNSTACLNGQGFSCRPSYTLKCPCQLGHVFVLILNIYNFIVWTITPILTVLMIILGGLFLIISGANPAWRARGWNIIKWTLLAAALIFCSWLIIDIVLKAIGYTGAWYTFTP